MDTPWTCTIYQSFLCTSFLIVYSYISPNVDIVQLFTVDVSNMNKWKFKFTFYGISAKMIDLTFPFRRHKNKIDIVDNSTIIPFTNHIFLI